MDKTLRRDASGTDPRPVQTVEVTMNADSTRLVGTCPTCGALLSVGLRAEGAHGRLVGCTQCKEVYQVTLREGLCTPAADRCGLGVSYAVEGEWDLGAIMEYLFDNIGMVDYVRGGFVCHPDEETSDFPTISVDEQSRLVRFGLFGNYQEQEAGSIINQTVSEFGARFQIEMRPVLLERWEHRAGETGFALVERRSLGTLLKDRATRQANA